MSTLTLDEILKTAIEVEVESQNFYLRGLEVVTSKDATDFLKHLVEDEKKHERLLRNLLNSELYDGKTIIANAFELPLGDSHKLPDFFWDAGTTIQEILHMAMKRENQAYLLFSKLSKLEIPDEFKILFENLAKEEKEHMGNVDALNKISQGAMGDEF